MTPEHAKPTIEAQDAHLRPYGVGGDYIGSRRARRSFRLLVIAALGFTLALYFVERYMRYDLNEVQYRMALTLEDDSQRAILRNVVRRNAEQSEAPTARYVEALAAIEEDDVVLDRFAEAVKLAPDKGSLLIVYGCRLFRHGQYREARQVFREATLKTTRNALPKYLQAAAQAASSTAEEDFRTAAALVGRTNDSGEPVLFPQPPWHDSLPRDGHWYASLRRKLAERCCEPLYNYKNTLIRRAREQAGGGDPVTWDAWLVQLQHLGERLLGNAGSERENVGSGQAIYGLQIQKDAIAARIHLAEAAGAAADAPLIERQVRVEEALGRLQAFEEYRENSVNEARARLRQPVRLALHALAALWGAWFFWWAVGGVVHTDRNSRALTCPRASLGVLAAWYSMVLLLLILCSAGAAASSGLMAALGGVWYLLIAAIMLFSLAYPAATLPRAHAACLALASEAGYPERLIEARACRRRAYVSLTGRLSFRALGGALICLCAWFIGHRIFTGLYPTDIKLLLPSLDAEEYQLLSEVWNLLEL
ncbi:MAG: hypothetical protein KF886_24525 [Candidatus Hydrogenedentes bacterium]|nr:hypothetical protein [Candidatus Hydrogenedentota bacterium]